MLLADFQVSGLNPSVVPGPGVLVAGVHYFPRVIGSAIGRTPSTPSATNATGQLQLPGAAANVMTEQIVRVRAAGINGTSTATIALYVNTGTITSPVYTAIAGTGSQSGFGVDWSIEAVLCSSSFQAASGLISTLSGQYSAIVNGAYHNTNGSAAWSVLDNTVTLTTVGSGTMPLSVPAVTSGLVIGATLPASALTVTLTQFQIFSE